MSSTVPTLPFSNLQANTSLVNIVEKIREVGAVLVTDVAELEDLRNEALTSIRHFTFVDEDVKEQYERPDLYYSVGWSRGKELLEGNQADTRKGSFYFNFYSQQKPSHQRLDGEEMHLAQNLWPKESPSMKPALEKLSHLVFSVCSSLIGIFDRYLTSEVKGFRSGSFIDAFHKSQTHKGRALVYYPVDEKTNSGKWCGEHLDHGLITGLISPIYYDLDNQVVPCPDERCGLYIRNSQDVIQRVRIPTNALLFQMGECAEILSGGKLRATSHWVVPSSHSDTYRATVAIFFNPNLDVTLNEPDDVTLTREDDVTSRIRCFTPGETFAQFTAKRYRLYH